MIERGNSIVKVNSILLNEKHEFISMIDDEQSTDENSSLTDENVKTDYRLSLPSSSQIHSYRYQINSSISERRKKFLSRIITIVALFLLIVCIFLVTLTLRLAHKIDELVRLKQLMPKPNTFFLLSTTTTSTTTTTSNQSFFLQRKTSSTNSF